MLIWDVINDVAHCKRWLRPRPLLIPGQMANVYSILSLRDELQGMGDLIKLSIAVTASRGRCVRGCRRVTIGECSIEGELAHTREAEHEALHVPPLPSYGY